MWDSGVCVIIVGGEDLISVTIGAGGGEQGRPLTAAGGGAIESLGRLAGFVRVPES